MHWRALAVVFLAFLAGCSTFGAITDGSETQTVTPAPVPEVTPSSGEAGAVDAPGITRQGIQDVDSLVAAHRAVIENESYVWHSERVTDRTVEPDNGTARTRQRLRVESDYRYGYWTTRGRIIRSGHTWFPTNVTVFGDRNGTHVRYWEMGDRGVTFERRPPTRVSNGYENAATWAIRSYLEAENVTVAATRIDGERYYRLAGRGRSDPGVENYTAFGVRATVSGDGFVRSLNATYTVDEGNRQRELFYRYEYVSLGNTTVRQPEWVEGQWYERDDAANGTVIGSDDVNVSR